MKNKKAMLMKEVIVIVLVIGGLVISGYFAYKISKSILGEQKKMQAQATLEEIINAVKVFEENNFDNNSIILLNPVEWYIIVNSNKNNEICICPDNKFKSCAKGVCEDVDVKVDIKPSEIEIILNNELLIQKKEGVILLSIKNG